MTGTSGPDYQRVANDLRSKISSGELVVGEPIPPNSKLMAMYDVSSTVTRRAVEELKNEGVLRGHGGKAVYVRARPQDVKAERASVEDLREQVAALREEVRELAEQSDSDASLEDMAAEVAEVRSVVSLLQVHLRTLYDRVGQPYPDNEAKPKRRRKSS